MHEAVHGGIGEQNLLLCNRACRAIPHPLLEVVNQVVVILKNIQKEGLPLRTRGVRIKFTANGLVSATSFL